MTSPLGRVGSITTFDEQGRVIKVEIPTLEDRHYHAWTRSTSLVPRPSARAAKSMAAWPFRTAQPPARSPPLQDRHPWPSRTHEPALGSRASRNVRGDIEEHFTYTEYGEVESRVVRVNGSTLLYLHYTYDPRGRIKAIEESSSYGGVTEYTYDDLDRVVEVEVDGAVKESYQYDENGNRHLQSTPSGTVSATFDAQDRLVTYGNLEFTYLDGGQLSEVHNPGSSASVYYEYDSFGTLRSVKDSNGDWVSYEADARGRRVIKKVNGTRVAAWLWSNDLRPVAELDGNNQVGARFIYANGINSPELMVTASGDEYRLIKDHLGSVRFVVNIATEQVEQEIVYDTWGRVIYDSNPGFQPFGFAGGLYDHDTGLVRFGARDYDPETGRWLAKDPIRLSGGLNLYEYAASNPVNRRDVTGLHPGDHTDGYGPGVDEPNYDTENQDDQDLLSSDDLEEVFRYVSGALPHLTGCGPTGPQCEVGAERTATCEKREADCGLSCDTPRARTKKDCLACCREYLKECASCDPNQRRADRCN